LPLANHIGLAYIAPVGDADVILDTGSRTQQRARSALHEFSLLPIAGGAMMVPEQISSQVHEETWAGVTHHIRGELVPELQVDVSDASVFFEHHTLLWKETDVKIEIRKMKGAVKRKIAGGEFFVTKAVGPGRVAFSRDSPGQLIPLHITNGEGVDVREHQFVAATDNVDFSFERIKGIRNVLFGGSGFFIARLDVDLVAGRVAIQTMYIDPVEGDSGSDSDS
jgi:hypothetical protein